MRTLKLIIPVVVLGGLVLCSTASFGKATYAAKEKKACTFCHAKQVAAKDEMNKNLTDAGKYYQTHQHSLEGYKGK